MRGGDGKERGARLWHGMQAAERIIQVLFRRIALHARRFPRCSSLCGYALLFLPLYLPLLLGLVLYAPGDTFGFSYPALSAVRPFSIDSLLADPFSGRGFPWLVSYGTFDPVAHLLRVFFDGIQALAWICYLYMVLSAWFFSLFLRRSGRSEAAAFLGGLLYAGAFFWVADGDYAFPFTLALFPAMLFTATFARARPLRTFLLLTLLVAYGWVAGHFNFVPIILVGMTAVTAVASWCSTDQSLLRRARPFLLYCIAAAAGSLLGLARVLPAIAYLQLSERAGGLSVEAAGKAALTLSGIVTAFFPYVTIPFLPGEIGMLFFGAAGLGLLAVGVLQSERPLRFALLGLAVVLLIALPHSPLYAFIQSLPFFSFLRTPRRWLFLGNACIAFIAASASDGIGGGQKRFVRGTGTAWLAIGAAVAALSGIVLLVDALAGSAIIAAAQRYFDAHLFAQTSGLPLDHYHRAIARLWQESVAQASPLSPRFLFPLLGLLLTGWTFRTVLPRARQGETVALLLLSVATILPPFFFLYPKTSPRFLDEARRLWSEAGIGSSSVMPVFAGIADQTVRTGVVGDDPAERVRYHPGILVPNTQALVGIRSIDFYQPIQPRRMARLLAALGSNAAPAPVDERLSFAKLPLEEKLRMFAERLPLLQRLGVQYVASVWALPPPFFHVRSLPFVARLPAVQLYRVPDARPAFSVPSRVLLRRPDEDAAMAFLRDAATRDPALIECVACEEGERAQTAAKISVEGESDTAASVRIETPEDVFLLVQRPRLPGWRVTVDGMPVRTAIGDGFFFAVQVPAGTHDVRLTITYPSLLLDSAKMLSCGCDPWQL